jgi:hypothetical protein
MDRTENDSNSSIAACIRCHGNVFAEPLPSNDKRGYTDTETDETDLWSTPLRQSFIKTSSGIHKLMGGGGGGDIHRDTECMGLLKVRGWGVPMPLRLFREHVSWLESWNGGHTEVAEAFFFPY